MHTLPWELKDSIIYPGSEPNGTSVSGHLSGIAAKGSSHRLLVAEREADEDQTCYVDVDAQAGTVNISQRSWFESRFGMAGPSTTR